MAAQISLRKSNGITVLASESLSDSASATCARVPEMPITKSQNQTSSVGVVHTNSVGTKAKTVSSRFI